MHITKQYQLFAKKKDIRLGLEIQTSLERDTELQPTTELPVAEGPNEWS